ncbi:hypothetical protein [Winogradskyella ursingii]|uniref:hypothetical protein n=1 Tax=Winogradskyella ursingii TaxID=2686079 RepID=UPI0015C7A79E|nr:hypothetical protein [Winogradskyella ursingii]
MQISKVSALLFSSILIVFFTSCVKDVDFEQAENITLTPTIASSILFSNSEASRFSDNGMELETVTDTVPDITILKDQFVNDNLIRAELVFEAANTINRTFGLQVDFLNEDDELEHTFSFFANPSSNGNEVITNYTEIFEDDSLEALKFTSKLIITLSLLPSNDGSMLNENSEGNIGLKSKGIFYFNVEL